MRVVTACRLLILLLAASCAPTPPPAPPLVIPVPDGPQEHRRPIFKWSVGDQLVYREECVVEKQPQGGRSSTSADAAVFTWRAEARTARGVQVGILDGSRRLGSVIFDGRGIPQDAWGDNPGATEAFGLVLGMGTSFWQALEESSFHLGRPIPIPVDLAEMLRLAGAEHTGLQRLDAPYEFLGLHGLGERRVAAFRFQVPRLPHPPLRVVPPGTSESISLLTFTAELTEFLEPDRGYMVAEYGVIVLGAQTKKGRVSIRVTCLKRLDETMSRVAP